MKKFSIIIPPNKEPVVIYFADEVIAALPHHAFPGQEDTFLTELALAFLNTTSSQIPNHFYVKRIKQSDAGSTYSHSILVADHAAKYIHAEYKLNITQQSNTKEFGIKIDEIEKKSELTTPAWQELVERLEEYEEIYRVSFTVPPHIQPFVIYFAEDALSLLAPLPPPDLEQKFLLDVAMALLPKNAHRQGINHFYIKKITTCNDSAHSYTHSLVMSNPNDKMFESNHLIRIDEKPEFFIKSMISDIVLKRDLLSQNNWKEFLKILDGYEQSQRKRALEAFQQAKINPPAPIPEPRQELLKVTFDAKEASRLFNLVEKNNEEIERTFLQRKSRLLSSKNAVEASKKLLEKLLKDCKEPSEVYDAIQLEKFAESTLASLGIQKLYDNAEKLIANESDRINTHPAHSALKTLFDPGFHCGKIEKQAVLETISSNYFQHETYAAFLRKVKLDLQWAVRESAREYYAEFRKDLENVGTVRAQLSSYGNFTLYAWTPLIVKATPLSEEERATYLEAKRKNFNEKFACVGIQITPFGQLIFNHPDLFLHSTLNQLQEMIRTLLQKCNTSHVGSSSAHSIVESYLKKFGNIIQKTSWSKFCISDSLLPHWLDIDFKKLTTDLFYFADPKSSYNPLNTDNIRVLKNLGGNIHFTWSNDLLAHEKAVAERCAVYVNAMKGSSESQGPEYQGIIPFLLEDILINDVARANLNTADEYVSEADKRIKTLEAAIREHSEVLKLQHRLQLPVNMASELVNITIADGLQKLNLEPADPLPAEHLDLLKSNAVALQKKALATAEQAKSKLECLARVRSAITARTLEQAGLDILEMEKYRKEIAALSDQVVTFSNVDTATKLLLKTKAEEELKIHGYELELKTMLANYSHQSIPFEITQLAQIITEMKSEFQRSLRDAIWHETKLAEALVKDPVDLVEIKRVTRQLNDVSEELKNYQERILRGLTSARKQVSIQHDLHQKHLALLSILVPVVMDLKFWAKQVPLKGTTVIGDDGMEYHVPEGIAAMVHHVRTNANVKKDLLHYFKENPCAAEKCYCSLRSNTNASNQKTSVLSLFGSTPRSPITDAFYKAVSTSENDRIAALETWVSVYKPDIKQQISQKLT